VAQIPDSALLGVSGIVLRVDAELWLALMLNNVSTSLALDIQAAAVALRAANIDVYALPDGNSSATIRPPSTASNGPHLLFSANGTGALFQPVGPDTVSAIRQQDLAQCIETTRARCVICAASNYHFSLPSGAHAAHFLRLAEAFVDLETVDRIAYWIALDIESRIPVLGGSEARALLVDHSSMLILAARVQLLVSTPLEIVTFPSYPSDTETRSATIELLERIGTRCPTVFVLIGVASTGRLARFVSGWALRASKVKILPSILYAVQDVADIQTFCRLSLPDYQHFSNAESCALCAAHSHVVAIQSTNYLVGYGPATSVALPPKFFEGQKPFLERWGKERGVLRVHYNDPNEATARHHAFYVDVGSLLNSPEFCAEAIAKVQALAPAPNVVAVPQHPTALRIGNLISNALNVPLIVLDSRTLQGGIPAIKALQAAHCLLVLDDVLISGSRLDSINRFLRENKTQQAPALSTIHFFTLLATPASEKKYRERSIGLTGNHGWVATVSHLYKFVLPDWHSNKTCPWCREQSVLSRLAQSSDELDGPIADRLADLADPVAGVTDAAYFVAPIDTSLPLLGSESAVLYANATPMQVLFSCASALQQLRHADEKALNAEQFPAPAYVAERVFSNNYTERIIWLGMLRALKANELDANLKAHLRMVALNGTDGQRALVHAEFAVAWVSGKLDAIDVTDASRQMFEGVGISWQALFDTGLVDGHP
jgi:hypothetical protein